MCLLAFCISSLVKFVFCQIRDLQIFSPTVSYLFIVSKAFAELKFLILVKIQFINLKKNIFLFNVSLLLRKRQNPKQAPGSELSAQPGVGLEPTDCEVMT